MKKYRGIGLFRISLANGRTPAHDDRVRGAAQSAAPVSYP